MSPPAHDPDLACTRLALAQSGVLSRAQALAAGMSEDGIYRRVRAGRWERVFTGVYRLAGSEPSWIQTLTAASLWTGEKGVVRCRSAGALWKLDECSEGPIELFVRGPHGTPPPGMDLSYTRRLDPSDVTTRKGLPVTTPTRTLLDLAAALDLDSVEVALEDALRRRLTSIPRLRWLLSRHAGVAGVGHLRKLIDIRDPKQRPTDSWLEAKLFPLLRKAKMSLPEPGIEITDRGRFLARPDFMFRDARLVIEAHSYRYHSGRKAWGKDWQRDKDIRRLGWRIIYVTYEDVTERPHQVIADIRSALGDGTLFA